MVEKENSKVLDMAPKPTEKCLKGMQTLEEFAKQLGKMGVDLSSGIAIGLEPEITVKKNLAENKPEQTWALFIWRGKDGRVRCDMKRGDLKFCRALVVQNLTRRHNQLILEEEPGTSNCVVGHVKAKTFNGIVEAVWNGDVDGRLDWELVASSLSKAELENQEVDPIAIIYANPHRLGGAGRLGAGIAVYEEKLNRLPVIKQDNPEWEDKIYTDENRPTGYRTVMSLFELLEKTHDCRTGFAMMKILLNKAAKEIINAESML